MDAVLGLSVTPRNVQTVLVEGQSGDGATLERDEFEVFPGDGLPAARASEQVAEAVLSMAEAQGQRLRSIGVTWSDDADLEASRLLDSLAELGLENVIAVKLPEAAEALACSIGRVIGYERTAVCVVEPETVILSLVDTFDGEVETLVSHAIDSDDRLIDWVTAIFDRDDWRPEGLFVVGSVGGLDSVATELEEALSVPVFDPPESDLALAHGAALASATSSSTYLADTAAAHRRTAAGRSYAGAMTLLVAGALTFVVSVSLAVGLQLVPDRSVPTTDSGEVVKTAGTPPIDLPVAPPPAAPAVPAAVLPPPPEAVETVPVELPAPEPESPAVAEPEVVAPDPPAAVLPPAPPPAIVPPVEPLEKPGILTRIKDKLRLGAG